jgi:pimeloyl-ACP methyl ester carboxylesterase
VPLSRIFDWRFRMRAVLIFLSIAIVVVVVAALAGWLYLLGPDIPYQTLEARYATPASHYVYLSGGVRLHYRDEGPKDAPVLLLVHGGGDNNWTWDGWVKKLALRYRIIRIDLPGHGLTRAPANYARTPHGDIIAETAGKLGLQRFAVGGNSLGGLAVGNFAAGHPDRVSALILVDSAGLPDNAGTARAPLAFRILQYRLGRVFLKTIDNTPLIVDSLEHEVGHPDKITPELVDRWAALQRAPGHREILLSGIASGVSPANEAAIIARLRTIKAPTLVLWGEIDPLTPVASGRKFAAAIPGAKLIVYPHTGHLPQIEIPEQSGADVEAFLDALPKAR